MSPRITEARHVHDYVIHLSFSDGVEGDIDLAGELFGPMFEPLKDMAAFQQFFVHKETRTLAWPNGADFAPEFLRESIKVTA